MENSNIGDFVQIHFTNDTKQTIFIWIEPHATYFELTKEYEYQIQAYGLAYHFEFTEGQINFLINDGLRIKILRRKRDIELVDWEVYFDLFDLS